MCFEPDSTPPVAPIAGAAVTHETLTLNSADGTPFAAFVATPDEPSEIGVVVLPDVRGLYHFYEELALRFAERGIHAVAIDYFGRTAGTAERDDDFPFREHVDQTTPEGIRDDVGAAIARLREQGAGTVFTVGFCFGGRHSWLAAADGHGIAGAVGFYGMPGERAGRPGAIQRAGEIAAPILALMAGEDQAIGLDQVSALDTALQEAGVEHTVIVFEGAPHSFFDRKQEEFAEASEHAWRQTLEFIARHS
jgi:carboxymethylenebutenolidase